MLVHGIYLKSRPKSKWHLVSVSASPENALKKLDTALFQAKLEGNDEAEAAIQIFDSCIHIPEHLSSVKKDKPLFN